MKNSFFNRLMIIAIFCFVMPTCGMDMQELVINVNVATASSLVYVSKELVSKTNDLLKISCQDNMPFLLLNDELGKSMQLSGYEEQEYPLMPGDNPIPNDLGNIRLLPLSVFMDENKSCKKKGDMLATVCNGEQRVNLELNSEVGDDWIMLLLQNFKKQPNYAIHLKDELLRTQIIEERNGITIHGPNGYFKYNFIGNKTMIASIVLLLVAACVCYKNQNMMLEFLKAFKLA